MNLFQHRLDLSEEDEKLCRGIPLGCSSRHSAVPTCELHSLAISFIVSKVGCMMLAYKICRPRTAVCAGGDGDREILLHIDI